MSIQLLILGNKMCDTKNNQTKGDLGLKLQYTPEKNLALETKSYLRAPYSEIKSPLIHSLKPWWGSAD